MSSRQRRQSCRADSAGKLHIPAPHTVHWDPRVLHFDLLRVCWSEKAQVCVGCSLSMQGSGGNRAFSSGTLTIMPEPGSDDGAVTILDAGMRAGITVSNGAPTIFINTATLNLYNLVYVYHTHADPHTSACTCAQVQRVAHACRQTQAKVKHRGCVFAWCVCVCVCVCACVDCDKPM